jgi:hypothetical protein
MAVRTKELKTVMKVLSSSTSYSVGGQVPTGMKRWVTFLQIDTGSAADKVAAGASQLGVYLASVGVSNPTKASIVATGNRKMLLHLRATQMTGARRPPLRVPPIPNPDAPLFSIAGGKWLGVSATKTTGMLNMQYYDE